MSKTGCDRSLAGHDTGALVELVRLGDCEAFSELMNRYYLMSRRTAFSILKNMEDAEDAAQEAFLKVFTKIDQFEGASAFRTWLTRIVINISLMRLRQRRNRPSSSLEELTEGDASSFLALMDMAPRPDQYCVANEVNERVVEALRRLPITLRVIAEDQIYAEATVREVAAKRGLSVSAVKSRLYRARRILQRSLASPLSYAEARREMKMNPPTVGRVRRGRHGPAEGEASDGGLPVGRTIMSPLMEALGDYPVGQR